MKIPAIINSKTNNFDFFRLLAAFLVFFGHEILVTRSAGFLDWNRGLAIAATGVNIFFIISGFLITKSWLENENFVFFAKKRFLRIYPGLIALVALTILVFGPIVTFFSIQNYFSDPAVWTYLKNTISLNLFDLNKNTLPGVFVTNKLPLIVNASLWTIPIEVMCYLLVVLFGFTKLLKKRIVFLYILSLLLLYGALASLGTVAPIFSQDSSSFPFADIIRLTTYFVSGIVLYLYKDHFRLSKTYFLLLAAILIGSAFAGYFQVLSYFLLPIVTIFLAFANINFLKKLTSRGDFSYGFYLFAFPVQQTVSYFFSEKFLFVGQFFISFALTAALAFLSWHLIEKHFLGLKDVSILSHFKKMLFYR